MNVGTVPTNITLGEMKMKKLIACSALFSMIAGVGSVIAAPQLTQFERLGQHLYNDKDLSLNSTQSCATCHHQSSGFVDPTNTSDPYNTMVSLGDNGFSKGGRNAPTSAYCGFSPKLHKATDGNYYGGMFWDGRKTGWTITLGDPLAEQAQGPPLNPVEMNMENETAVITRILESDYAHFFEEMYGPVDLTDDEEVLAAFDYMATAIAAFERSSYVTSFTSKFDDGTLSGPEENGYRLVQQYCTGCHADVTPEGADGPVFTNYGYVNIGVPVNDMLLAVEGTEYTGEDLGLGGTVAVEELEQQKGKFKVPTLRNVAVTAPYSHNGYFPTLHDIVSFHNDRDAWYDGTGLVYEEEANLSDAVGDMGLTATEINDIVAFLHTLTDKKGNTGK